MRLFLILLYLFGCATAPEKLAYKPLTKSELKQGQVLVFGRYYAKDRRSAHPNDLFTYTLDDDNKALVPNFEGKNQFFWMLVPSKTKVVRLKTITTMSVKYSSNQDLARANLAPIGHVPIYLGEIVPTTDIDLKNVEFTAGIRQGQNYLYGKHISEGNFVLRKFESASGLKQVLNRIQEKSQ